MNRLFSLLCLLSALSFVYARLNPRIIDGELAYDGQFPYQISLQVVEDDESLNVRGGGIIGEQFVLTAAHCVTGRQGRFSLFQFKVVVDSTDLRRPEQSRSIDVEKVYLLKSWSKRTGKDDNAVLKLKEDIGLNNTLSKLKLPRDGQTYAGHIAKIAGYGVYKIHLYEYNDDKLRYLDVNVLPNDRCQQQFGNSSEIYDSQICGQAVKRSDAPVAGICRGDSGGPLVIGNTVIGIASMAGNRLCNENSYPGRYTRVSSYLQFADNAMKDIRTDDMRVHHVPRPDEGCYLR